MGAGGRGFHGRAPHCELPVGCGAPSQLHRACGGVFLQTDLLTPLGPRTWPLGPGELLPSGSLLMGSWLWQYLPYGISAAFPVFA